MSVLVDKNTRLIVQGFTGKEGTFHASTAIAYGTNVVGGVNPKRAGESHVGVPIFASTAEAAAKVGADVAVGFIPPPMAKDASVSAAQAGVKLCLFRFRAGGVRGIGEHAVDPPADRDRLGGIADDQQKAIYHALVRHPPLVEIIVIREEEIGLAGRVCVVDDGEDMEGPVSAAIAGHHGRNPVHGFADLPAIFFGKRDPNDRAGTCALPGGKLLLGDTGIGPVDAVGI